MMPESHDLSGGVMNAAPARRPSVADKRAAFRKLHESGCFLIPNPWDVGSARYLESLGFKALASTSSGFAWSRGLADNTPSRDAVLAHLAELAAAVDVPINADFENGFGAEPSGVAESVKLAVAAGVAGISIEDSVGPRLTTPGGAPLFAIDEAVERVRAARRAIDAAGGDALLIGRAECFLTERPDIGETVARLKAYAGAGADCLYAPGISSVDHIRAVVDAVRPKAVNLLVGAPSDLTLARIAELGVRRVSVGGALAGAAWGGFMAAAKELAEHGSFAGLARAASHGTVDRLFER
jgi:2-methylisocitrate lyase-like PEP mutase family enzyme